ncbi:MAG: ABC transporter permease [Oscillospiraceae bacterium]
MKRYFLGRVLTAIPVFFGITLLVFSMMNLAPGSIADLRGEGDGTLLEGEAFAQSLGLDDPFPVRYVRWLGGLLRGDLGTSYRGGSVGAQIAQRVGPSLLLTGTGLLLAVACAIPLGIVSAWKPKSFWGRLAGFLSYLSFGVPGFLLSLLLIALFGVALSWLPTFGMYSGSGGSFGDLLVHLALPSLVICLSNLGGLTRQTRSACMEVLGEDYIRTARAKGLREWAVVVRHGFRTALIPVLTAILSHIPHILGGSVVVERIFGWPGMGSLLFSAISNRDYPVVMGVTVVVALAVLGTGLLLDLVYGLVDPRITYEGGRGR